ncbi:MAG: hypothetical protein Q9181_005982 [Wetmoreana brouardii]
MSIPPPSNRKIYTGTFIHTPRLGELEVLERAAVGVNENGIIEWIDEGLDNNHEFYLRRVIASMYGWDLGDEEVEVVCCAGGMLGFWFPGFVDTHTHASQLPNAGLFGASTLLDWLDTYTFPLESSFSSLSKARRVYNTAVSSTLRHGTTTAAYYSTIHPDSTKLLADICLEKGQRAFVGNLCMDRPETCPDYYREASAETSIQNTMEVVRHIRSKDPKSRLIHPILTPRFAPSCSEDVLYKLGKLAQEEDLPVQTHISENTSEIALVRRMFPKNSSYADVYDSFGLLTPRTVLAHCIHFSSLEVDVVKERGCGVSHCPVSNTSIGSGICPVRQLLDRGVKVGLGTDVSGGRSSSVLTAAREAAGVSRLLAAFAHEKEEEGGKESDHMKLDFSECLYLATRGGAECLGLGDRIGAFKVGMEWDAQMVRLADVPDDDDAGKPSGNDGLVQCWGKETWEERVAKWMYCGDDRNTMKVYVKGRLVHER